VLQGKVLRGEALRCEKRRALAGIAGLIQTHEDRSVGPGFWPRQ